MSPSSSAVSITSDGNLLVQPEAAAGGSPPGNNMEEAGCVAAAILWELNAYTGPEIPEMWKERNAEGSYSFVMKDSFILLVLYRYVHIEKLIQLTLFKISDVMKILNQKLIFSSFF